MPDQIWNAGVKVMLLNDTSLSPRVGSIAVSAALERLISLAGTEITPASLRDGTKRTVAGHSGGFVRTRGAITDFGRTLEGRRRDFGRCIRSSRRIHLRLWALSVTKNGKSVSHRLKRINNRYHERMSLGRYLMTLCAG